MWAGSIKGDTTLSDSKFLPEFQASQSYKLTFWLNKTTTKKYIKFQETVNAMRADKEKEREQKMAYSEYGNMGRWMWTETKPMDPSHP